MNNRAANLSAHRLPLAGVRVIEFSQMVMGPCCGFILAELGAEVIKVEPLPRGDRTRYLPGLAAGFLPRSTATRGASPSTRKVPAASP
jgi:crotonobetainyl-CoA:carnitine CoA-transferase CaiB-like acyl-CoA transferase